MTFICKDCGTEVHVLVPDESIPDNLCLQCWIVRTVGPEERAELRAFFARSESRE